MSDDYTQLILLHHYRRSEPAIDESDFLSHGQCLETQFSMDGAKAGSGALEFTDQSVIKVPLAPHWEQLRAIIIDVMVRFDGTINRRRNIVEADGLFALFLTPDGALRFDMFSLVNGQTTPRWNGISTVDHAVADAWIAQPSRWQRLRVAFDGLSTAKIWVDSALTAQRNDFRSSLGTPGGHGISIGNWTLSNQYPLNGALDYVAIWKLEADQVTRDFVKRLDPDAINAWGHFMECLSSQIGERELAHLDGFYQDLLIDLAQCIANCDETKRLAFYKALEEYYAIWATNLMDERRFSEVLRHGLDIVTELCGPSIASRFDKMANMVADIVGSDVECFGASAIDCADPRWRAAIERFA